MVRSAEKLTISTTGPQPELSQAVGMSALDGVLLLYNKLGKKERRPAMAGEVSKEKLESVLMQAMLAANNLRPQRDRLVELRRRLQQQEQGTDGDDGLKKVASELFKVHFFHIEMGARYLNTCLTLAAEGGARVPLNPALAVIPDGQLYDVLLAQAQRLPASPATQTQAFYLVESAYMAVKLAQEHHLPRCIELLIGERPPNMSGQAPQASGMAGYSDDPVKAAFEHLAKNGLPRPAPAPAAGRPRAVAGAGEAPPAKGIIDPDQALTYLHRGCSLAGLAVKHIDLAVAAISSFLDPEKVASLSNFTEKIIEGHASVRNQFSPSDE